MASHKIKLASSLLMGRAPKGDDNLRRYGSILRGGATAVIAKAVAALAGFASVPLTLGHLGPERYGLWASLYSILAWLYMADLGLANGLMNALSEAFGKQRQDLAREYVATAFWGLGGMALLVGAGLLGACQWIDWSAAMNIRSAAVGQEFGLAMGVAAALFVVNLPFSIVGRIYIAYQQGEIANFWAVLNTLGGLLGLLAAIAAQGGLATLVLGFSGGQTLVGIASAIWLFGKKMPELRPSSRLSRSGAKRVFGVAASFFITQIATLMLFQSANLIIAHFLGPEQVAPYQVTWMLFFYVTLPQQLIGANIWAAIGESYARGDVKWIKRLFVRYLLGGVAFAAPCIVILASCAAVIIKFWAGAEAVPSRELVYWMAAWACVLTIMQPLIAVLGGTGKLHAYSLFNLVSASASVVGAVWAVQRFGSPGVIAATVIGFVALSLLPAIWLVRNILQEPGRPAPPSA